MSNILIATKKLDTLHGEKYLHEVQKYLNTVDIYLDTLILRRIKKALSQSMHGRQLLQDITPKILHSLDDLVGYIDEKELLEASCFYQQVHTVMLRDIDYIIDLCAGNGLIGATWLLEGAVQKVYFVDTQKSKDSKLVQQKLYEKGYGECCMYDSIDIQDSKKMHKYIKSLQNRHSHHYGLITAMHACGVLADKICTLAVEHSFPFAIVPCCHTRTMDSISPLDKSQTVLFSDYFSVSEYADILRIVKLIQQGYSIQLRTLPREITEKNRIFIGFPLSLH